MTLEVLKALLVVAEFCIHQNNCNECALRDFCAKMPCEW